MTAKKAKRPATRGEEGRRPDRERKPTRETRFTTGTWSGHPNYECSACPFKTLNRVEIEQHWQARHAPALPRPSSLVDSSGQPLVIPDP